MSVQPTYSGRRTGVRVVVAGDRGTGKSSLIVALATETFADNLPPVLPPTTLPADLYPDGIPVTVIDTSSSMESSMKRSEELKRADAVMLTYACDQPMTLSRISSYWLPELRRLEVNVPVILVGCKLDLRDEHDPMNMEAVMTPIMQRYREIETCIECSAATFLQVPDAFYYAQKAVLHPTLPLFDQETQSLQPRCVSALRRIFTLCDHDMDGALNDQELNGFQVKCFNAPLQPEEIIGVQRVVQEKLPEGVNENGLTLDGFLFLHALFIEKGRLETTWAVMRKFGYEDDLKLRDDFLTLPFKAAPDQSVELTTEALEFLRGIFRLHDTDNDGAVRPTELDMLFATAPESPWSEIPYLDAAERTALGDLTLNGFLSEWALMTLIDPKKSMANLIYIGYRGDPASALHLTRRRKVDRKKQKTERNVFNCFVFGPKNAGKSAIINSFIERPFSKSGTTTTGERWAVNAVDEIGGNKKTLVLREIPEDEVKKLLSKKNSLAACDVAVFVYDSSDERSWKRSKELLAEVARKGDESEDYLVPCLLIAAKDDLDPYPMAVRDSLGISQELGIEAPIRVSMKQSNLNNVFGRIVHAAKHPHLSIPETETRKNRKKYRQLFNRSLTFVSVGTAAAVVGLVAYRAYAARKSASA
ncbi:putative small GTPase superfamily, EF-hand domain pair [Rosa chinensis]|uniref:Mitochondrial Rho GTPase n=1 Tax=Rosa chinensis TaxID=74649 RepID=A0A2P6PW16_ROSCH|nr:mitochondrial Rho GTPase 2 [Rosa chinensis]PRQ26120.1 putative small GTPase superfamily, EF-hand domain pair [Rosa chinensis]